VLFCREFSRDLAGFLRNLGALEWGGGILHAPIVLNWPVDLGFFVLPSGINVRPVGLVAAALSRAACYFAVIWRGMFRQVEANSLTETLPPFFLIDIKFKFMT